MRKHFYMEYINKIVVTIRYYYEMGLENTCYFAADCSDVYWEL